MNPIIPILPYQKKWIEDSSRFLCGMWARQTGKTFSSTLKIVNHCLKEEAQGRRCNWIILSVGERQAKEAMNEGIKLHLQTLKIKFETEQINFNPNINQLEVILPGGSRIGAIPANPDTARGFSRNIYLDEFSHHKDSRKIWQALFPIISNGYKMMITSTPNGRGNKFYDIMTSLDKIWSKHTIDIYRAVNQGLDRDTTLLKKALNDEDGWSQEYELKWLDEASSWLSFDLINRCEDTLAGHPEHYTGQGVYVGVDIAARGDLFVIYILERVGDVLWERERIERQRISFAEQHHLLSDVFNRYTVIRCCIDQTGMGEKPVEDAKRSFGSTRVEGVLFNVSTKQHMANCGKQAFEDRKVRIAAGDELLRADLHKLKKEVGLTGNVRFIADRDSQGHADRTWALFLSIYAAQTNYQPLAYTAIKKIHERTIQTTHGIKRGDL